MPELPEVETVRRGLAPSMEGAVLRELELRRNDLRFPFPTDFARHVSGRGITSLSRRAKYLLIDLENGKTIISHLGMSGSFRIESASGAGSTFRVWLPLPEAEVEIGPVDANAQALPPLRILVADDNPINQTVARAVLEASGAVVETAADGAQALDRLRLSAFDVVLMDVHMPTMDGVEAVGRIRDGQAGRSDVPVIALTADAMAGEEARLKAMGFDALQHKPVQPAALIGAISLALAGRSARAEGSDAAA